MEEVHGEELYKLHLYSNIIRRIKSRKTSWAEHAARMGEERKYTGFWWESQKVRDHLEDQGVDGRMESALILGRLAWEV
jgi:hypothetical protein